jgi:hypothetical protein
MGSLVGDGKASLRLGGMNTSSSNHLDLCGDRIHHTYRVADLFLDLSS